MLNRSIKSLVGVIAFAALLVAGFNSSAYAQQPGGVTQIDVLFANDVAWSSAGEISVSQIARQFAVRQETREYAQRMITEHTQALNELIQMASAKAIILPAGAVNSNRSQTQVVTPNQVGDAREQFDFVYLNGQIEAHEKLIELLQAEAMNGSDADLKAYATRYLSILEEHLRLARQTMLQLVAAIQNPVPSPPPQQ